jgi:cell division initiation protein
MSVIDVELAQRATPDNIRRRRFAFAKRGYDPDQVREYLDRVAAEMERFERMAHDARGEVDSLSRGNRSAREDAYAELANRVADVLRTADRHAEEVRRLAAEEAERAIEDARVHAERLRMEGEGRAAEARREAEEVLRRAREDAERMLQGLASRRDAILADLQQMRERLVGVVANLETTIEVDPEASTPDASAPDDDLPAPTPIRPTTRSLLDVPTGDTADFVIPELPDMEIEDDDAEG